MLNDAQRALAEENLMLCYDYTHRHIQKNGSLCRFGWEFDDILAITFTALCRAAEIFDSEKGYKFTTLFYKVCDNAVSREVRTICSKKRFCLPGAVLSFDRIMVEKDGKGVPFADVIADPNGGPEQEIDRAEFAETMRRLIADMNGTRKKVFELYQSGMTQQQIAKQCGVSQTTVNRQLQRAYSTLRAGVIRLGFERMEA